MRGLLLRPLAQYSRLTSAAKPAGPEHRQQRLNRQRLLSQGASCHMSRIRSISKKLHHPQKGGRRTKLKWCYGTRLPDRAACFEIRYKVPYAIASAYQRRSTISNGQESSRCHRDLPAPNWRLWRRIGLHDPTACERHKAQCQMAGNARCPLVAWLDGTRPSYPDRCECGCKQGYFTSVLYYLSTT